MEEEERPASENKRYHLIHRIYSVVVVVEAARRLSVGSRGLDLKRRRDVLVSRLVLQSSHGAYNNNKKN